MFSKTLVSLALAVAAPVFAQQATPAQIATVKAQFTNALIVPAVVPAFNPMALLNVSFPATGPISTGQAITKDNTGAQPNITVIGDDTLFGGMGPLSNLKKFTVMMIDGNYAGAPNTTYVNVHYLQTDVVDGSVFNDVSTLSASDTQPVIAYAGPGPAENSGAHRYILLMFVQPDNFQAPPNPPTGGSVTMVNFPQWLQQANLSDPIAGNYFTVEVGTAPTVTASQTSAVNTAAVQSAASQSASQASGSKASTASGAGATSSQKSGALKTGVSGLVAGVAIVFAAAFAA